MIRAVQPCTNDNHHRSWANQTRDDACERLAGRAAGLLRFLLVSSPFSAVCARLRLTPSPRSQPHLCRYVKPATVTLLSNAIMALGASAETGKIFDFNLTLPIMAGQFLLLMVFLDKTWFSPVGTLLDDRDKQLREKLATVKGNSGEVSNLQEQAEKIIADARSAAQKKVADAKSAVSTEAANELAAAKAKVDAELSRALAGLESEKDAALKGLDAQVAKLSDDILARVLPEGVKV